MEVGRPPGGCKVMTAVSRPPGLMETRQSPSKRGLETQTNVGHFNTRAGTVPEGCRVGWAGRAGDGRARVYSGGREEGRAGALEDTPVASCGPAAA